MDQRSGYRFPALPHRIGKAVQGNDTLTQVLHAKAAHTRANLFKTNSEPSELITLNHRVYRETMSPEVDHKEEEILLLQRQLEETKQQLDQQQKLVKQQQETIKVQSDTIQAPRSGHNYTSPQRQTENITPFRPHLRPHPHPQPNNPLHITQHYDHLDPRCAQTPSKPQGIPNYARTAISPAGSQLAERQSNVDFPSVSGGFYSARSNISKLPLPHNATEFGSPVQPRKDQSVQMSIQHKRKASSMHTSPQASRPQQSIRPNEPPPKSMAMINASRSSSSNLIEEPFRKFFKMTEMYAFSHVNFPSNSGDYALPAAIKDRCLEASSTESAHFIMSNTQSRYLLMSKIMNQWIIKNVLHVSTYKGFNAEIDSNIETAKAQIYQTTPASVRYLCLSTIATETKKLHTLPGFQQYVHNLCRARGNLLWAIVKPLMHRKTSKDWDDLFQLMQEAHKLWDAMVEATEEYCFDFPKLNESFAAGTMLNRDPNIKHFSPAELMARGALVRLGSSPHIIARRHSAVGQTSARRIRQADVLLKWGNVVL